MGAPGDDHAQRSDRRTVGAVALALGGAAALWRSVPLAGAAAALAAVAAFLPGLARPLAAGLGTLARAIGRVNAWILLGFAFLVVLTPLAVVRRLIGRGHPAFRAPRERPSTWIVRAHRFGPDDLTRPW